MLSTCKRFIFLRGASAAVAGMLAVGALHGVPAAAETDAGGRGVCLQINRIDHTEVLNDHQILFYELGGRVWVNNLTMPCRTLTRQDGFAWSTSISQICSNVEQIRVLRTGESCLLGAFTPYTKPGKS